MPFCGCMRRRKERRRGTWGVGQWECKRVTREGAGMQAGREDGKGLLGGVRDWREGGGEGLDMDELGTGDLPRFSVEILNPFHSGARRGVRCRHVGVSRGSVKVEALGSRMMTAERRRV